MGENRAGENRTGKIRTPGALIGRGRAADVYEYGEGRVLRRYRSERDHAAEVELMAYLRERGYPVPEVFAVEGRDMVMERVVGPTMLRELGRRPWRVRRYAKMLADLHRRLHAFAPPPELRDGFGPRETVLHLDLHPDNVLLTPFGPVVIDWSNAAAGAAGADVAKTVLIMALSETEVSALLRPLLSAMRKAFLRTFVAAAQADPAPYLPVVGRARVGDPHLTPVEAKRLDAFLEGGAVDF